MTSNPANKSGEDRFVILFETLITPERRHRLILPQIILEEPVKQLR